jgi:hypothetical protein
MESWVNLSKVVQEQEQELQVLKSLKKMPKKELQIKRNRITAQLSRDRKQLEYTYLMNQVVSLRKKLKQPSFCQNCQTTTETGLLKVTRVN